MPVSNKHQITGKYVGAHPVKDVSDTFKVQSFFIDVTNNEYTNIAKLQVKNGNLSLLNGLKQGQEITATFSVNGGKAFTNKDGQRDVIPTLDCYRIDIVTVQTVRQQAAPAPAAAPQPQAAPATTNHMPPGGQPFSNSDGDDNDLPF